jgi:hypothetical protein
MMKIIEAPAPQHCVKGRLFNFRHYSNSHPLPYIADNNSKKTNFNSALRQPRYDDENPAPMKA